MLRYVLAPVFLLLGSVLMAWVAMEGFIIIKRIMDKNKSKREFNKRYNFELK